MLAYRTSGDGPPVVLLHGNPTSSHLWRHVMTRPGCRWIAPDLIGMGASPRPGIAYSLADHIAHVEGFLDDLGLDRPILVGHDWGCAIALSILARRPSGVRGVAVMEGHLRPLSGWDAFDEGGRALFQRLRTWRWGERMVLDENFFLDTLLPAAMPPWVDLAPYREPYTTRESRRPLLAWARQIPVGGEPVEAAALMAAAAEALTGTDVPVLLVHGEPGVLVTASTVEWCRAHVRRLTVADVGGPAGHFLPEERPDEVADALAGWVRGLTPP